MRKKAIIGFKGVTLLPVENTATSYKALTEGKISLPFAGSMSKTIKESSQDLYYDDGLYASVKDNLGADVEMRFAEVDLATLKAMGVGDYDDSKGIFEANFTMVEKQYSLRCKTDTVSGIPFYFNYRLFTLTSVRFDNFQTKGSGVQACEVIVQGTVTKPALESAKAYAILDPKTEGGLANADNWLGAAETLPGG